MSLLDRDVNILMDHNRTALNDDIQKVAIRYGDGIYHLVVVGTYATDLLIDDDWLRETAVLTGGVRVGRIELCVTSLFARPLAIRYIFQRGPLNSDSAFHC